MINAVGLMTGCIRQVGDGVDQDGDGLGDSADTDGEIIDGQVGTVRSGRLVFWDEEGTDGIGGTSDGDDYWARDVGIDDGAASAEEPAVHLELVRPIM
ncbi:DUF5709 domain-containing protein [Streptomyces sp. NBC_01497]|uniref:DUF5709 domain-containing protein n=1 Tax=Streptomyces sp. NBC_01497 TaxID=2903885 RepID=UPI002E308893|nr:DUF5709 domain-containing protein [Streptomyces sp. NBC_01497]